MSTLLKRESSQTFELSDSRIHLQGSPVPRSHSQGSSQPQAVHLLPLALPPAINSPDIANSAPKQCRMSAMGLMDTYRNPTGEIRRLEANISEHPFPESSRPRQAPAMTRYKVNLDLQPPLMLTRRKAIAPPEPVVPTPLMQPEIIDLTLDD
ncbi:hypothetical protein EI94DRAFT_1831989 [Lactarius quietus]|nr:hypothetical protein EI94DRAFT_1831989 [Lactarius quietus]